jgi:Uma2 family endonuclease
MTEKDDEMSMPAWATDPSSLLITEAEYEALPSDVCRSIEVVDGTVVFCASPTPAHQQVSRNLTLALLTTRPPSPCINVLQDIDMRFRHRNPYMVRSGRQFTLRRPDVVVLRCLEPDALLWSDDVLVAIEITSSDDDRDFNDKRAVYAAQGTPAYLIVVVAGSEIDSVAEYRLDWSGRNYQLVTVHRRSLTTELPEGMKLDVPFRQLEQV